MFALAHAVAIAGYLVIVVIRSSNDMLIRNSNGNALSKNKTDGHIIILGENMTNKTECNYA